MKKLIRILGILPVLFMGIIFSSCDKDEKTYEVVPFKSISLTCDGETTDGVVKGNNIKFIFNEAESFSEATIKIDLNEGWEMTFPKTLTNVNLEESPVFNFKDYQNKLHKYYVKFSSNAFPVIDSDKIQICDLNVGEGYTFDNSKKELMIHYDQDVMEYNNITIKFLDGALQDGVSLPDNLTYDFTQGLEQCLVLDLAGPREYKVILDVSAYQKKHLNDFNFENENHRYNLEEDSPVQVFSTSSIQNLPVNVTDATKYAPNWDGNNLIGYTYGGSNPRTWEGGLCDLKIDDDMATLGYRDFTKDDIFTFPGDWKEDRPVMNAYGRMVIIYFDRSEAKVGFKGSESGVKLGDCNNLVVATGLNNNSPEFKKYYVHVDGQDILPSEEVDIPYRATIASDEGKIKFGIVANKGGKYYEVPWQNEFKVDRNDVLTQATKEFKANSLAWVSAYGVKDGKALGINQIVANDGTDYVSDAGCLGLGWSNNFYNSYILVGTTYDNKIALMINAPGNCNWDGIPAYPAVDNGYDPLNNTGFNYRGYSMKQMFWLAAQLGWKDAVCISQGHDDSTHKSDIKVNGIGVISSSDGIGISEAYDNNGSGLSASYLLTIDKK